MARIQLGKFEADGKQYQQILINRRLGPSAGEFVDIGRFASSDGNHNISLDIYDVICDKITQYRVFANPELDQDTWILVDPVSDTGQDISVFMKINGTMISVRMTRYTNIDGARSYRVKCLNLRPVTELYYRSSECGPTPCPVPPYPVPPPPPRPHPIPPVPPAPYPPEPVPIPDDPSRVDYNWLVRMVIEHISAPAPHAAHEVIARKDRPNGYAGIDAEGHIKGDVVPTRGKLTIKIGEQIVVFDGSNDVEINLSDSATATDMGIAIATNINTDFGASDNDIAALFDDDMSTPSKAEDDPGYIVVNEDDTLDDGEVTGDTGDNTEPDQGSSQSGGSGAGTQQVDDDI